MNELPVNSPTLPAPTGIVTSPKQFSDGLTMDLTDDEITRALRITLPIRKKWSSKFRSQFRDTNFSVEDAMDMLDKFESELKYELATKLDLLVSVDVEPVLYGEPAIIVFEGALPSHTSAKYGMDHERKEYEVKRSKDQGDDFLGIRDLDE